jgi:putative nucleotidyltransferase with HDIG domain
MWLSRMIRQIKNSLRFRLFLLVFFSVVPGIFLAIYSVITKQHYEDLEILIIGIAFVLVTWLGGDLLIVKRVNKLVELSKRLSSGDLTARSGQTDHFGPLGELTQALDQIAASLEEQTKELQKRANEAALWNEMANEISVQEDLSTLLELVVDKMMAFLATSQASLALYDPARDDLEITVVKGYQAPIGKRIQMGEGAAGRAAQARQPVIVNDYRHWEDHLSVFEVHPFSSVMHVPIIYREELIGVLGVAEIGPAARKFSQADAQLLSLFANLVATEIKNVRLFKETRSRLQELEAINEVSTAVRVAQNIDEMLPALLEKTMSMVNAIMGGIWLYDLADNSLHQIASNGIPVLSIHLKPGEGITGMVFSTGQPYFASDWREDPLTPISMRSQIPAGLNGAFLPIRTAQSTVGVLTVGFHSPYELSDDQKHLLTTIAEIAGNAIHRMQLHEQTKNQLQRLSALHQIDLAITSSLDLGNTLQVLLDQVITQLGVDATCVLVFNSHEQTFEFAASHGFTTDALRETRLHFGEGYAGRAALDQQTIYVPDLKAHHTDFMRSPSFSAEGFVSYYAIPLVAKSQVKGVLEVFHRSLLEHDPEWLDFLEALASQAAIAIENASLFSDLQRSNIELNLAYDSTLEGWSRALELRDQETKGHSQRVAEITLRLARAMSVEEADLVHIRRGALLHDIGKLGIPDYILLKPGSLSEEEKDIIQKHPTIAFEMLVPIAHLRPALDIPYCHHERWDGSGYPRGLKGEQIPLAARIFAIVDVWDALTSDRPYRKRWSKGKARAHLQEQAGHHFDPRVVDVFISLLDRDNWLKEANKGERSD